jgi:hypothetical protein
MAVSNGASPATIVRAAANIQETLIPPFGGDVLMPDVGHPRNARKMLRQCTMRICDGASDNVGVANQVKSAASLIALVARMSQ